MARALPCWRLVKRSWANKKEKKTCPTLEDRVETSNLQIHSFSSSLHSCMWAWKTLHPRKRLSFVTKRRKNDGWNGWDRCGRCTVRGADWPQAATVTVGQPISARWLWRRRYSNMPPPFTKWKTSLVRLTKSFPTIPNLRGIANANQNDERFKMWSVMPLCTIALRWTHPCMNPKSIVHPSARFATPPLLDPLDFQLGIRHCLLRETAECFQCLW